MQSGKPVGVFRTHEWAPRVLIANSNLVPEWATWEEFRRLEDLGLTMYGQMTAGSWIYIGTQGIVQGTYECFAEIARRRFGGSLAGTITLTAGLGGMGGAQPLAVTMNGGVALCVEVDAHRIQRRLETRYLDEQADALDDAVARCRAAKARRARAVGRAARQRRRRRCRSCSTRASRPTSSPTRRAPTTRSAATCRTGCRAEEADALRRDDPDEYVRRSRAAMAAHCAAMVGFHDARRRGLRLRQQPARRGAARRLRARVRLPRLRARLHPAAVLRGQGPVPLGRAVGRPGRHRRHRPRGARGVPRRRAPRALDRAGRRADRVPGAAGADLLARLRRAARGSGCASTRWCASGELQAPIVIGRDHLDSGSVASPYRETEAMADGSDAIADWPLLNALVNTVVGRVLGVASTTAAASASGARSTPAWCASPTAPTLAAEKLERVLTADPGTGVIRHADAGYDRAIEVAEERGVRIPMRE